MPAALRGDTPGIVGLAQLLSEHGGAVEADLAFRGVDLRDLWRPGRRLTWRRLAVLLAGLPQDSATHTVLRDAIPAEVLATAPEPAGHGRWSHEAMLLAAIADGINYLRYEQVLIAGAKDTPRPAPTPRPGLGSNVRPLKTPAMVAYLNSRRAKGA